uniref:SCAN box domain-containing protein n=1 Tax=Pygocentrus nattereri TaxID=42514 RepID=A0AAR2L7V2_PYGNA
YFWDFGTPLEVILKKYEISAETYRQRFRATDIWPDETPWLYVRLKELIAKWTKPEEHSVQQMSEILILEQFMRMVSPDMAVWIKEHDPGTAEEAARLAEVYISASGLQDLKVSLLGMVGFMVMPKVKVMHLAGSVELLALVLFILLF